MYFNFDIYFNNERFSKRLPEVEQLGGLTKYITGHDYVNDMNCYSISFGWPQELSVPQLVVEDKILNAEVLRQSAPSNCFMVFIGGKYVDRLEDIFQKVKSASVGLATKPSIYFAEKVKEHPKLDGQLILVHNNKKGFDLKPATSSSWYASD